MIFYIDTGLIVSWVVLTVILVWAIGSFCVQHGRHMELKVREELINKRRDGFRRDG